MFVVIETGVAEHTAGQRLVVRHEPDDALFSGGEGGECLYVHSCVPELAGEGRQLAGLVGEMHGELRHTSSIRRAPCVWQFKVQRRRGPRRR